MADSDAIKRLASEMNDAFTKQMRTDGSDYWMLRDGSPEWMKAVCYAAHNHGDVLPDDWRYKFIWQAVSALAEDDNDEEDARDSLEADIYTGQLTAWLASNVNRVGYVDSAEEEFGGRAENLIDALQRGQLVEMYEVFDQVYTALNDRADDAETEERSSSNDAHSHTRL